MDKFTYIQQAERQLRDDRFYTNQNENPTQTFVDEITTELNKLYENYQIDQEPLEYLKPEDPKLGRFYLLLTAHKVNNPCRSIVSANGHPTEYNFGIRGLPSTPTCRKTSILYKDTTDLNKMRALDPLPPNTTLFGLVTMDVTLLYTNILYSDGNKACREVGDSWEVENPPTDCLVTFLPNGLKTQLHFQWRLSFTNKWHSYGYQNCSILS